MNGSRSSLTEQNLKRLDSQNSGLSKEAEIALAALTQDKQMQQWQMQHKCQNHTASRLSQEKQKDEREKQPRPSVKHERPKIQDFDRLAVLGEGAFGKVYRVLWHRTGRKYALKRIEKALLIRVNYVLEQEGKQKQAIIQKDTMLYLAHPNVVKLFETFQDRKYFYYLMELVPNGTLGQYHDRRSFTHEMVKFYSAQIVALLDYLFSKQVAHRDIKPQNLLLDERYHLKLADFATSKRVEAVPEAQFHRVSSGSVVDPEAPQDRRKGTLVGTRFYVAPEVLDEQCSGYAADLWSLGCIIYKLICGRTPFEADNEYLVYEKIKKVDLNFSKQFDDHAMDLITRLLQLKPKARIGMSGDDFTKTAMHQIKEHPFFEGINFATIFQIDAPTGISYGYKHKLSKFAQRKDSSRKVSDQSDFSSPQGKTRTDEASTEPETPFVKHNLRALQMSGYFEPVLQETRERGATHLSVSGFIKEDGIFDHHMQSTKTSFAFYGGDEDSECKVPIEKSKYFEPVKIFNKSVHKQEVVFNTKLIYQMKGLKQKKIIASLTSEPRLLLCDPNSNAILEDIPLTFSLEVTRMGERDIIMKTTYGKAYRFKVGGEIMLQDSSSSARDTWCNLLQFAVKNYYLPKVTLN